MKIMVFWDMTPCILLDKYQDPAASTFQVWKFYLEDECSRYLLWNGMIPYSRSPPCSSAHIMGERCTSVS